MGHFPSVNSILFSRKKLIVYYGFLGDANFGDELVYESARLLFEPYILIPFRQKMPLWLKAYCQLNKRKFHGILIGGGTLIGPFWERKFFIELTDLKKPVYLHGTGAHPNIASAPEWKKLLSLPTFGGVRGRQSVKNLESIGVKAKVIGDAAFAFFNEKQNKQPFGANRNVLINMGTHEKFEGQNESRKCIKQFISLIVKKDYYHLQFLPFHSHDLQIAIQLKEEFPEIEILNTPKTYREAIPFFDNSTFAIGERLHFIVMAILSQTPFLSINYGRKHIDLLESLDVSEAGLLPGEISLEKIIAIFENKNQTDWITVSKKLANFKELQQAEAFKFLQAN
jgi:polysaccharide pyruvyl transferase WcaK-like protein